MDVDGGFDSGLDSGFDGVFKGGFDGGFNGGFDGGFHGGFDSWFHLAVLGYRPQQGVWQLRREAFTAISPEGLTGSSLNKLVILQTILVVT